ncbi:MAG: hypothetical protein AB1896_11035, partial [Thermodesulfobacteriota bacterium]
IAKGQHFLPLKTGGQISINTSSFPIIELGSGQRIILDLDQRLPQEMVQMIQSNYPNYTIFRPKRGESLPAMLGRLFDSANYYRVEKKGQWTLDREVKVKIAADWIIWPTEDDFSAGRAVVINLPTTRGEGTSPDLATYLATKGVQVIDFHARGNLIGPEIRRTLPTGAIQVEDMQSQDVTEFVKSVLGLVGQRYETDLSIPLVNGSGSGGGFDFTVHAPIYFSRGNTNYVVAVEGMSDEMRKALEKHKFKVIVKSPGEGPSDFARKLLQAMNIKSENGLTLGASQARSSRNIEVVMPGVVFKAGGKDLLLTPSEVPETLAPLLAKPNLRVVKYLIANPT